MGATTTDDRDLVSSSTGGGSTATSASGSGAGAALEQAFGAAELAASGGAASWHGAEPGDVEPPLDALSMEHWGPLGLESHELPVLGGGGGGGGFSGGLGASFPAPPASPPPAGFEQGEEDQQRQDPLAASEDFGVFSSGDNGDDGTGDGLSGPLAGLNLPMLYGPAAADHPAAIADDESPQEAREDAARPQPEPSHATSDSEEQQLPGAELPAPSPLAQGGAADVNAAAAPSRESSSRTLDIDEACEPPPPLGDEVAERLQAEAEGRGEAYPEGEEEEEGEERALAGTEEQQELGAAGGQPVEQEDADPDAKHQPQQADEGKKGRRGARESTSGEDDSSSQYGSAAGEEASECVSVCGSWHTAAGGSLSSSMRSVRSSENLRGPASNGVAAPPQPQPSSRFAPPPAPPSLQAPAAPPAPPPPPPAQQPSQPQPLDPTAVAADPPADGARPRSVAAIAAALSGAAPGAGPALASLSDGAWHMVPPPPAPIALGNGDLGLEDGSPRVQRAVLVHPGSVAAAVAAADGAAGGPAGGLSAQGAAGALGAPWQMVQGDDAARGPGARAGGRTPPPAFVGQSMVLRESELVDLSLSLAQPGGGGPPTAATASAAAAAATAAAPWRQLPPAAASAVQRAAHALSDSHHFRAAGAPAWSGGQPDSPISEGDNSDRGGSGSSLFMSLQLRGLGGTGRTAEEVGEYVKDGIAAARAASAAGAGRLMSALGARVAAGQQRAAAWAAQQQQLGRLPNIPGVAALLPRAGGGGAGAVAGGGEDMPSAAAAQQPPPPADDEGELVFVEHTPDLPHTSDEAEAAQFGEMLFLGGRDSHGRPVAVVDAEALPSGAAARGAALAFLLRRLAPVAARGPYVLVLASPAPRGGAGAAAESPTSAPRRGPLPGAWCVRALQSLPRPLRKNVRFVVAVRPGLSTRAAVALLRPFVSAKGYAKVRHADSLIGIDGATGGEVQVAHLGPEFLAAVRRAAG
jgi:hypothetical protein